MIINIKVKEAREKCNISLKELAAETGIKRNRLSEIENKIVKEDEILKEVEKELN